MDIKAYYTILNSELHDLIKDRCMIFSLDRVTNYTI